jgi:hypothetical protein
LVKDADVIPMLRATVSSPVVHRFDYYTDVKPSNIRRTVPYRRLCDNRWFQVNTIALPGNDDIMTCLHCIALESREV